MTDGSRERGKKAFVQTSAGDDFEREDDALDEARGWMHISKRRARYIEGVMLEMSGGGGEGRRRRRKEKRRGSD